MEMSSREFLKEYETSFMQREWEPARAFSPEEVNAFMWKWRGRLVESGANACLIPDYATQNTPFQYRRTLLGALTLIENAYLFYANNALGSQNRSEPGTLLHEMNNPRGNETKEPESAPKSAKEKLATPVDYTSAITLAAASGSTVRVQAGITIKGEGLQIYGDGQTCFVDNSTIFGNHCVVKGSGNTIMGNHNIYWGECTDNGEHNVNVCRSDGSNKPPTPKRAKAKQKQPKATKKVRGSG